MTIQFTPAQDARSRARAHMLTAGTAAGYYQRRQQRLEALRGRGHEKTVKEWVAELGVSDKTVRQDLRALEEDAKPGYALGGRGQGRRKEPMSAANFDHSVMAAWLHRPIC